MLAQVSFHDVELGPDALLGPSGFSSGMVLTGTLDLGRYSVAAGSVGIIQACLDACAVLHRAAHGRRFARSATYQLIQAKVTDMVTDVRAGRLLVAEAGRLKDAGEPATIMATWVAKYFASTAAAKHAAEAVQIHGANGCSGNYPVARLYRDAKVMEIIEGSNEIQRITIAARHIEGWHCEDRRDDPAVTGPRSRPPASRKPMRGRIKCIVWDLDNTLWDGVLLEDGEVTLRPWVAEHIRRLDAMGVLHSIASKNDHETAMAKLTEFGLAELFLYPQINWNAKSSSIQLIAKALNLGLDAFAFVDDQEFERAEVGHELPGVICVDIAEFDEAVQRPEFRPRFVTDESAQRRLMYQGQLAREELERDFVGTNHEFLASLDMPFTIETARRRTCSGPRS